MDDICLEKDGVCSHCQKSTSLRWLFQESPPFTHSPTAKNCPPCSRPGPTRYPPWPRLLQSQPTSHLGSAVLEKCRAHRFHEIMMAGQCGQQSNFKLKQNNQTVPFLVRLDRFLILETTGSPIVFEPLFSKRSWYHLTSSTPLHSDQRTIQRLAREKLR